VAGVKGGGERLLKVGLVAGIVQFLDPGFRWNDGQDFSLRSK
jgi:hypothetical protein